LLLLRWRRRSPSTTFTAKLAGSGREAYAAELRERGVHATEIARRLDLLKNHSASLEADRWDRFYGDPKSNYNRAPNAFLEQVVQSMKPGTVLDYAMGGRGEDRKRTGGEAWSEDRCDSFHRRRLPLWQGPFRSHRVQLVDDAGGCAQGDRGCVGHNGMLHLFDELTIERYEMVRGVSDFSDRRETEIYRLIARK
jgi:hypothetical protein